MASYGIVANQYKTQSYAGPHSFAALFLAGASVSAPSGSNLIAPAPVGRYGATAFSNTVGAVKNVSRQLPTRSGPRAGWIALTTILAFGGGGPAGIPPYGN